VKVWIDDHAVDVGILPVLGHGGEADVYDLGDRALKLYKGPRHPDVAGDPVREAAAATRLADLEERVGSFPRGLPARVVAPRALAWSSGGRRRAPVGIVMDKVGGVPLHTLSEPKLRRTGAVDLGELVGALRDLHLTLCGVHAAGVVVGDFNDGNVLVDGARAHLIDADSFQWGRWPCSLFTERFVDPRLCDPAAPAPALIRPHDRDSDWFGFAVMVFRTLVWVGPFGGVHQPRDPARRVAPAARPLRGPTVFDPEVVYPRAAVPLAALSDELRGHFEDVFVGGARGRFPAALLDRLRLTRCTTCGLDHARAVCPGCRTTVAVPVARGALTVRPLDPARFTPSTVAVGADRGAPVWLAGGSLWRATRLGPELIGQVVAGATRAWLGARLGAGLWRAGGHVVGFTFRPDRRGVDDRARLPAIRGAVLADGCVAGDDRAWLWWRERTDGRDLVRVAVVGGGRLHGFAERSADDADWMAGLAGACPAGAALLVPTDDGVVRVEVVAGAVAVTRRFPDTAPLVGAGDDLAVVADGLAVARRGAPVELAGVRTRTLCLTFTARPAGPGGSS